MLFLKISRVYLLRGCEKCLYTTSVLELVSFIFIAVLECIDLEHLQEKSLHNQHFASYVGDSPLCMPD